MPHRTQVAEGRVFYRTRRVDWRAIGWAVGGRMAVAVLGSLAYCIGAFHTWPF